MLPDTPFLGPGFPAGLFERQHHELRDGYLQYDLGHHCNTATHSRDFVDEAQLEEEK